MSKLLAHLRRRVTVTETPQVTQHTMLLRPPERTWRQKISDFFWDKKKKMCLTRTPLNWLMISVYYTLFLAVVILIFYISMVISEAVASRGENRPQYVLDDSPVGGTPSLNFFPVVGSRNLIWLSQKRAYKSYVKKISNAFKEYKEKNNGFNETKFGNCSKAPFGYKERRPCLFFRINRVLLYKPIPFEKGDKLPKEMPQTVKDLIQKSKAPKIWLTCNGTTAKDRDHMSQDFFQVQGEPGFDPAGYPFRNQRNYVDPIIAVQLNDSTPKKVLYTFTCTAWGYKMSRGTAKVDVNYYIE